MWHSNLVDRRREQSPPGPYTHQGTISDRMSVSSATTNNTQHQHQPINPPTHNNHTSMTYFYPSSHLHNSHSYPTTRHAPPLTLPPQSPTTSPQSLTKIIFSSSPHQFSLATKHPFLRLAGQGRLPKHILSKWLSQDRLYAQSYLGFIGSLIARVDLPYANIADKSTSLRWRIVNCLSSALSNIHTELTMFNDTAGKYGLDLQCVGPGKRDFTAETATKQYIDLFRAFWTDPSMSLLEGMVVLWATEKVYLSAWGFARSFLENETHASESEGTQPASQSKSSNAEVTSELEGSEVNTLLSGVTTEGRNEDSTEDKQQDKQQDKHQTNHSSDLDGGALRDAFIPNWTSKDFEGFVGEIAELTDLLAEREDAVPRKLDVYKAVWAHILDVERRFWPDVGGLS